MSAGSEARGFGAWWIVVVVGAISVVIGVAAIVWPDVTLLALALMAGLNLMIMSGLLIGQSIADGDAGEGGDRTMRIVVGILGIIAGIVVIRRPGETVLVLLLAVAIWLILTGIVDLVRAVVVPGSRFLRALGGAVDIGLGVLILALPDLSLHTLAVLIGVSFIVRGALMIAGGWLLRGAERLERPGGAAPLTA